MNLDFDLSVVTRFFRGVVTELRQKRLWPVAALLLVAIVAVPFLLSKSAAPAPATQAQVPTPPPPAGASIPTLNVQTTPSHSHLTGSGHDPFASGASTRTTVASGPATTGSVPIVSTATATSTGTGSTSGGSTVSTATSNSGSSGSSPVTSGSAPTNNPPSITPGAKPKPAPSGLKATQAYDVSLAITNSSGGINTTDPLQRLSVIPSAQQPLLVELGVARDGNHILFAVQPGAIPTGPGTCTPGPIDCEILSLGQDQTEELSTQQGSVGAAEVALFAVTSISAKDYPSKAAADRARRDSSAAGEALLKKSSYPSLSLFQYEPSVGSVVDLRNLKVGG
ncbi:MAG TPA: hypothetical protein VKR21_03030 [Solirubrobacteraceae bacterium]|nr:hypothetical protein [Solirubrobacteraceae bacterium]